MAGRRVGCALHIASASYGIYDLFATAAIRSRLRLPGTTRLRFALPGAQRLISLADDLYIPNVSVPLFVEYESVAKREGMLEGLSAEDIEAILDYLLKKSSIRKIFYLWWPFLKDPKDDLVLEVAVESQSEYIITFNKKDFKGIDKFGIKVLTPKEFLIERGVLK